MKIVRLLSMRKFAVAQAVVHFTWFVVLAVTWSTGWKVVVPGLRSVQKFAKFVGIYLVDTGGEPFTFKMTAVLCSAIQFIASCHLVNGILIGQDMLKKFWACEQLMTVFLAGSHSIRALSMTEASERFETILGLLPFHGLSMFYIYCVWNSVSLADYTKVASSRSVSPSKIPNNRKKPPELLQAFTALSIVGFVAVSVVSTLTIAYVTDNKEIATEWWTLDRIIPCLLSVMGVWGILVVDLVVAPIGSEWKPGAWLASVVMTLYGTNSLISLAKSDAYFDSFAVLYFVGVCLPSAGAFVVQEAARIKFGLLQRSHVS